MRFESYLAVLLASLVVLAVGSNDGQSSQQIFRLNRLEGKKNSIGDASEKRSKRSLSDSDRDALVSSFNSKRSAVGASDMNYVGYDFALEAGLDKWTSGCNYDATVSLPNNYRVMRFYGVINLDPKAVMQYAFNLSNAFYTLRSIHVTGAAASVKYCQTLIVEGNQYNNNYLEIYGITTKTGLFNGNVQQYMLGPACTRCQSNVAWCYKNLCRADCSSSISGCCRISKGRRTSVCASTQSPNSNNGRSGTAGIKAIGTAFLHGFLFFFCYYFQ